MYSYIVQIIINSNFKYRLQITKLSYNAYKPQKKQCINVAVRMPETDVMYLK